MEMNAAVIHAIGMGMQQRCAPLQKAQNKSKQ